MISRPRIALLVATILIVAVVPRIYQLGATGFYGDEEITSLAAHSYAIQEIAAMPSGLPYHRALPHTWVNAVSAKIFGLDQEISYRIASCFFGIATVLLLYFIARHSIGVEVALVAAFLLALSEWHISISREARMYAPFLFFYLASAYSFIRWHENSKNIIFFLLWLISAYTTIALHNLGIFFALFPLYFLILDKSLRPLQQIAYIALSISLVLTTTLYHKIFVSEKFSAWTNTHGQTTQVENFSTPYFLEIVSQIGSNYWLIFFILLALPSALYFFIKINNSSHQNLSISQKFVAIGAWLALFALAFIGYLYAAAIAFLILLLIQSEKRVEYIIACKAPITIITITSVTWLLWLTYQQGPVGAIKQVTSFPYPYFNYYVELTIGLLIFFVVGVVIELLNNDGQKHNRIFILATIVPISIVGLMEKWGALRYILATYPFLILIASYGLIKTLRFVAQFALTRNIKLVTTSIALFIVCLGILGLSGIPQAWRAANKSYGDSITQLEIGAQLYPDHKTTGEYVRENLQDQDIIIAEDVLQQFWYVGRVDYWLRAIETHGHFTYLSSTDGQIRDLYINSLVADNDIVDSLRNNKKQRIWLITSAETQSDKEFYLSKKQLSWMNTIMHKYSPAYVGLDGVSKVYCINCNGK